MKWSEIKVGELVKVVWRDIASVEGSWQSSERLDEEARKLWDCDYVSVGFVVTRNSDYMVIAASKDGGYYADASMIPISVVKDVQTLK